MNNNTNQLSPNMEKVNEKQKKMTIWLAFAVTFGLCLLLNKVSPAVIAYTWIVSIPLLILINMLISAAIGVYFKQMKLALITGLIAIPVSIFLIVGYYRMSDFFGVGAYKNQGVCVVLVNHTDKIVDEAQLDGHYIGGGVNPYGGGGGVFCGGTSMPAKWHEGLTMNVRWTPASTLLADGSSRYGEEIWHEKSVTVPYYPRLEKLFVSIFPNDDIRVDMLDESRAPYYPYPLPVAPLGFRATFEKESFNEYRCKNISLPSEETVEKCLNVFNLYRSGHFPKIKPQGVK